MSMVGEKKTGDECPGGETAETERAPTYDLIEALFFAYRDFIGDPDRILSADGFGRAHHRVLHFVNRNPGLTIAELLEILRITKQSLNRVLKELLERRFIDSRPGLRDRRQRLLFVTEAGKTLAEAMARLQTQRIVRALQETGVDRKETIMTFLIAMIDADERDRARALITGRRQSENGSAGRH